MKSENKQTILIKTFVLGANHGQYLQAYGLLKAIGSISNKYIIYHPFYNNHWLREFNSHIINLALIKYFIFIFYWLKRFRFKSKNTICDIEIYGSDMIWHLNSSLFRPDKFYFTPNKLTKKIISYAPSVGSRIEEYEPNNLNDLKKFNHISVRDINTKEFVRKYLSISAKIVCDPALFLSPNIINNREISDIFKYRSKNIVTIYGNNRIFKPILNQNQNYTRNTTVRSIGYFSKYRFIQSIPFQFSDPLSVIKSFRESKLILTTTFHGVILSLLTQRPFLAITNENLSARLTKYNDFYSQSRLIKESDVDQRLSEINLEVIENSSDINFNKITEFVNDSYLWLKESLAN